MVKAEAVAREKRKIKLTFKPTDMPVPQKKNPVKEIEIVKTFKNKELTKRRIIYRMDVTKWLYYDAYMAQL